jgi:hypothetical protein
MEVEPMDTVQSLKEKIRDIDGVPVECQRLTLAGQELKNSRLLADYKLKPQSSSLLPVASACGAGKVAQMLRENRTVDLQIVPLTLDQNKKERGDLDAFIEENTARISYLRSRQQLLFKDHTLLSTVRVQVPTLSIMEVATSNIGVSATHPESSPRKLSSMKIPGSPALSCASLATRAPSEDDQDLMSLPSSRSSSPCSSPGASLEIDMPKLAFSSNESYSLDAFTRENSARAALLLKRLHERRVADGF